MKTEKLDAALRDSGFEFHRNENGTIIYENRYTGLMLARRGNKIDARRKQCSRITKRGKTAANHSW